MSGHTPGPWRVLPPSVGIDANWHVTDEMDTFVAHVYGFAHSVDEKSKINARLISAAPDLLEALERMIRIGDVSVSLNDAFRQARAAIAKARGAA